MNATLLKPFTACTRSFSAALRYNPVFKDRILTVITGVMTAVASAYALGVLFFVAPPLTSASSELYGVADVFTAILAFTCLESLLMLIAFGVARIK